MSQEERQTSAGTAGEGNTSTDKQVQQSKVVTEEDFRKFQSTKDREVAEARRIAEEAQRRAEEAELKMEALIQDPAVKAQLQTERIKAQLDQYKAREEMESQKRVFQDKWGVPVEVLADAATPSDITLLALNWLKAEREAAAQAAVKAAKEREVEELEDSGAHQVSLSPGTTPDRQRLNTDDIEKRIKELRAVSQGRGSAAEQARIEIYKLERERQQSRPLRARV